MRKLVASVSLSLDGVMQAPGGPTEDPTGDFKYGGWLPPHTDEESSKKIGELFSRPFDLLLGRRTYDILAAFWPYCVAGPFKPMSELLERVRKYVVTHGQQPLTWQNSEPLASIEAVAQVKHGDGSDILIQGSSTLYPPLLAAGLIDRLTLFTFPVLLGSGKRPFSAVTPGAAMRLVDHIVTSKGVIVATYEPAGEVQIGSFLSAEPSQAEITRRKAMAEGSW